MKSICEEDGYIDSQFPAVITAILLLIGLVHLITHPESSLKSSSLLPYVGLAVIFAILTFGYYSNMSSLKCPESPFNKHVSPFFLGLVIIGGFIYAAWKVNKSPYQHLVYVFSVLIGIAFCIAIYLGHIRTKTLGKTPKPETRSPAQRELDVAMSKAGNAFKRKEYEKVVQILQPHLGQLPQSQRKRYDIAKKYIQK